MEDPLKTNMGLNVSILKCFDFECFTQGLRYSHFGKPASLSVDEWGSLPSHAWIINASLSKILNHPGIILVNFYMDSRQFVDNID